MKTIIKFEEAAMFGLCLFFLYSLHVPWWGYVLLVIAPDISMLGYLAGNKVGADTYNFFHHKGVAIVVFGIGVLLNSPLGDVLSIAGIILFGHSSMDRMLGYGLKLSKGFKYTHLGMIGKNINES
ncbi:MAG: DUF4260 domain-containing protein [Bacteroidetes bacterium]|nr:DUF4260 domain-containing protein [Bacteroidota bacterium]MBS1633100.1 DUF4260 domain-containing protein [Bacteroidota bacterium]